NAASIRRLRCTESHPGSVAAFTSRRSRRGKTGMGGATGLMRAILSARRSLAKCISNVGVKPDVDSVRSSHTYHKQHQNRDDEGASAYLRQEIPHIHSESDLPHIHSESDQGKRATF